MASWPSALLPRIGALVVLGLLATATLTFAAERRLQASSAPKPAVAVPGAATLVVPEVRGQVYVFAEGILDDAGFGWRVAGKNGYAANVVVSQTPAPGTKVVDTGAPLVVVTLAKRGHAEKGTPVNVSPFAPTELRFANEAAAAETTAPAATPKPAAAAPAATPKPAAKPKQAAAPRKPDFVVAGAPAEPTDEVPLVVRAKALDAWLTKQPPKTNANVKRWLYQNEWIVTGAKFGWWHGAQALRVLVAADRKAEKQWGLGVRSEAVARAALAEVEARAH
jgi:PASTA domain